MVMGVREDMTVREVMGTRDLRERRGNREGQIYARRERRGSGRDKFARDARGEGAG